MTADMSAEPSSAYDVIVVGAGPGGYVAAIRAAQLGLRTAVVERAFLGGICLNWGCIPTKALLRSAEILHEIETARSFGIVVDGAARVELPSLVERSRTVAGELTTGVGFLLKKNGVDVIWGEAQLKGSGVIDAIPRATSSSRPERALACFLG
jgi:dihydrolipoamide dehydrogenase